VLRSVDCAIAAPLRKQARESRRDAMPAHLLQDAIEVMDDALGIYDAADRLVIFNSRYRQLRSAIGGDVRVGAPWLGLVKESVRRGAIPEARDREQQWLEARYRTRGSYSVIRRLSDGRAFRVNERKLMGGGIAVIWTDVTNLLEAQEAIEILRATGRADRPAQALAETAQNHIRRHDRARPV
jgi:hypothetical protein